MAMLRIEKQLAMGTLLGKSCLYKPRTGANYFMTMPPVEDRNWFLFKCTVLKNYARPHAVTKQGYWRSKSGKLWTDIYYGFYKELTMDGLNQLGDIALATWFLDKGFFISRKRICLRTTSFGLKGNMIIEQFFNEVDIPCEVRQERGTGRIVFTKTGTLNFLKVIASSMPDFMYYRLEEKEPFYEEYKDRCINRVNGY